ncbi:acyl-CoA oxidase [Pseudohyphozyma bogoriensis]|nr:acyl-CoA oxidase [Pseudohyphozyma bogoriensis]
MSQVSQSTKDLQAARATATFSPAKMGEVIRRADFVSDPEVRRRMRQLREEDPAFSRSTRPYMSRAGRLEAGMRTSNRVLELAQENGWDYLEYGTFLQSLGDNTGLHLHEVAFQPVINSQGSDEQKKLWMPRCTAHEILGCYLQTELGHGSNVQGLETTATYDSKTEEFVIDSPTVSSTKWWIGALGITATHGVVQARLIINGKDFGPHLFITQLRSLEDHSLMPGVEAGEIGPKAHGGFAAVDNGWARFNHVRVPRSHMLARFAQVSASGEYTKPPHSKLSYGGMIFIRAQMIGGISWSLAKAATIATRYLHIRRQFADTEAKAGQEGFGVERQVITYPSVYMRIIPQIAKSVVFLTAAADIATLYASMAAKLASGDMELLAETHAVSSGLKVYVSTEIVEGIETCRRAMGGHGYMDAAGVGKLYAKELPSTTYEGDNFILNLQVARAALKSLKAYRSSPTTFTPSPSSAYLTALSTSLPITTYLSFHSSSTQLLLIQTRAALHVDRLQRLLDSGRAWSDVSWECVKVARAVVEAYLVGRMLEAIDDGGVLSEGVEEKEKAVLRKVVQFFILHTLELSIPDLLEFGIIPASSPYSSPNDVLPGPIEALRRIVNDLAKELLPETVALVDSFDFSDYDLDTEIGKYDGRAYESLLERAKRDADLNAGDEATRERLYEQHIKPILQRGREINARSKL